MMEISTDIYHLEDIGKYASEKPYTMRYTPKGRIAPTNVTRKKHQVKVQDMRGKENCFDLERTGFMVKVLNSKMAHEDYESPDKIKDVYLPELEGVLKELFPASSIDFVSYLIRKRDNGFPYASGESYEFGQPNIVAHIDATPDDLVRQIRKRYGEHADQALKGRCQYITVWKPLKGPLYDWPLALCDGSSVDTQEDLEAQDIVAQDEILENFHMYHRPQHRWHYLNGHQDFELFIFRQADTEATRSGTPHCAIYNPKAAADCMPRESIEVVAFVYSDI